MKISHESPLSMLEESRLYNDYDYALVHLFDSEPNYYQFFKDSLTIGREVILDNSIFELGKAFDSDKFAHYVQELRPTAYIIPDVLEDSKGTIKSATEFLARYPNLPGTKIGVVQGKSYQELKDCYYALDTLLNVDKIAFSFDYSYYTKVYPHPNKFVSWAMGRVSTLTRLIDDKVINTGKPHHLLGCSLPIEFFFYRENYDWIESLDTSSPIVHGLLNIAYEPGGLVNKQSIKLVDLLHASPTDYQKDLIYFNVYNFSTYVRGEHNKVIEDELDCTV